ELERLRRSDIPAGRQSLREQHGNLHRVAEYCESNYLQASDKRKALEETMALSTQSLASVTYQVSSLATAFLRLLDLQAAQLRQVEADVTCVAQRVDIHKEKVSRREIGSLTVSKRFPPYQKIVAPPDPPSLEPYYRKPLNFSVLDDVGHGIKDHSTQLSRTGTLARKSSAQAVGTLGRSARVPEPVQPPVVPEGKLSVTSSTSSLVSLRYRRPWNGPSLPGPSLQGPPAPGPSLPGPPAPSITAIPPPPPLPGALLPPPSPEDLAVPPPDLPPPAPAELEPPPSALPDFEDVAPPPPPSSEEPSWVPENSLEKVVALYPYTGQKDNELSFPPGALLFVTRRYSDGWCEGVLGQEVGFFPGNYVEPC
ncbi:ABI3 protein, partial [Mionectes macconnelli]|nr:ABI3 protein [Mionectes macconnelli]